MLYPWTSRCWAKTTARKAKGKKSESNKDEKDKEKDKKGKGKTNPKATENFAGDCLLSKAWGHMEKDCWWNESAERVKDTASLSRLQPRQLQKKKHTTEPPIAGMLMQSDGGEVVPADPAQWLYSVTKRDPSCNDVLIGSGAATSVCQQSMADSLGRTPRGPGVELKSTTEHQFTTTDSTTTRLRTRDGINVAVDFQIARKDTGLQRSIMSVGQVCDRSNIITSRSFGGTILNEFTGNRIEFERAGGVYRLRGDTKAKTKSETGVEVLMVSSKILRVALKRNPQDLDMCLYCRAKLKLNNTS